MCKKGRLQVGRGAGIVLFAERAQAAGNRPAQLVQPLDREVVLLEGVGAQLLDY